MVNKPPISVPAMPDLSPAIQLQYEKAEPIKESDSYLEIWEKLDNRKPDLSLREGKNQYTRSFEEDWEYFKESYLGYSKNPEVQKNFDRVEEGKKEYRQRQFERLQRMTAKNATTTKDPDQFRWRVPGDFGFLNTKKAGVLRRGPGRYADMVDKTHEVQERAKRMMRGEEVFQPPPKATKESLQAFHEEWTCTGNWSTTTAEPESEDPDALTWEDVDPNSEMTNRYGPGVLEMFGGSFR